MLAKLCVWLFVGFCKLLTGVRFVWQGCEPSANQRVYYANHSSHADFALIWSALPKELRKKTRAVAAYDYWTKTPIRRFIIQKMFNAVLVDRAANGKNPIAPILEALKEGYSIIIFPEGTRNKEDELLAFKAGIYLLAKAYPHIEIVPIWLDNLKRVMPKGHLLPLPFLCALTAGEATTIKENEGKEGFLQRLREGLIRVRESIS